MSSTPIATIAGRAREELAASLAALQHIPNALPEVTSIASSLASAIEPLHQVEKGGAPELLLQARAALQETVRRIQQDTSELHPVVADAAAIVARELGVIFATIHERGLGDPAARAATSTPNVAPEAQEPSKPFTLFPRTAARPQFGASGLPRIEAALGVHSESNFYTNFLGDIRDHGGIFIETWTAIAVGTACEVELQFPGDLRADVRGVVRWRREIKDDEADTTPGLGVEIIKADDDAWALIQRFIGKREPIVHDL